MQKIAVAVAGDGKMATYEGREVRKMGIGALAIRTVAVGALGWAALTGGGWVMERISNGNTVVEQGYVNPKSLSIQGKKNATGNIESYLQYKSGEEVVSLPCMKGPAGPLCGTVEYWWESIGSGQREGLAVEEWPALSNGSKHGILGSELQAIMDAFYGAQKTQQQQGASQQYGSGK